MVDKLWMRCTGIQLTDTLVHCAPNDHECSVPAITVGSLCCRGEEPAATSPTPSEAGYPEGGTLNPREVKTAREKEIMYLWDMEVYEYSTEAEALARTGRNPVGLKWIDTNKGSAEAPRSRSRLVCTEVRRQGVEPIFSGTPPLETLRILLSV